MAEYYIGNHPRKRNWNPLNNEFLRFIFYSIIGAIIFLLIYSLWFNPQGSSQFFEEIKDKTSSATNYVVDNLNANSSESINIKQNSSVQSCLKDVNDYLEIAEAKSIWDITTDIKEYQKFDNTYDALDYLKEWEYIDEDLCYEEDCSPNSWTGYSLPALFELRGGMYFIEEHSDIIIVLVRTDIYTGEGKLGSLEPLICIDGEL